MFGRGGRSDAASRYEALARTHAVIEFTPAGEILDANRAFLDATGYQLDEIRGQHHRIFMPPDERESDAYREFWRRLAEGAFVSEEVRRVKKSGEELWLRASYVPLRDANGRVSRVFKLAADVTGQKREAAMNAARLSAAENCFAVIEFTPDGEILYANENFLTATGYRLEEIVGQHHRIFVEDEYAKSADYASFWRRLAQADVFSGEYKRVRKSGEALWIRAVYSPVKDHMGRVVRVVKYAADITDEKVGAERRAALQQQLHDVLQRVNEQIEGADRRVNEAKAVSGTAAENVQSIASGAEQYSASIQQISQQVEQARGVASDAAERAKASEGVMAVLADSARKIGEVLALINDIADQTNLLALNATIEAARAGEAGKGFAVVATEVKQLAAQTAKATGDIADQINAMQTASDDAARAINDVSGVIERISEYSAAIAASVSEQSQATSTISDNLRAAAERVTELDAGLSEISRAADASAAATQEAGELSHALI